MSKSLILFCAAYIFIAVVTFGYAAANTRCVTGFFEKDCRASTGLTSAMVWPLYWSWEVADRYRDEVGS